MISDGQVMDRWWTGDGLKKLHTLSISCMGLCEVYVIKSDTKIVAENGEMGERCMS